MRRIVFGLFVVMLQCVSASAQTEQADTETKMLRDTCKVYLRFKDGKISASQFGVEDSLSVGFCKGFFRGFLSGISGTATKPDESGHVKQLTIVEGTTIDQAVRVFSILIDEKPELVSQDAGVVVISALMASDLAKFESGGEVYVRKK